VLGVTFAPRGLLGLVDRLSRRKGRSYE
jgi:hypothetical protein